MLEEMQANIKFHSEMRKRERKEKKNVIKMSFCSNKQKRKERMRKHETLILLISTKV